MTEDGTGPAVRVVAAVIEREGRYLLGRRPIEKRHGGLWEFPGGKLDPGESVLEAARRELSEELALEVTGIGPLLWSVADGRTPFIIEFVEVFTDGTPRALEHEDLGWFAPDVMRRMDLAPADAAFVRHLAAPAQVDPGTG
ncbi:MAG: NUDIX domain-containing protein [Gemmatimonadota bacterium]